ncbi:MAG: protein kinase domain-containing protein [Fimbriiglobus sp.]
MLLNQHGASVSVGDVTDITCPNIVHADYQSRLDPFPQVPCLFHGFELNEVIGQGAFSKVYLANQKGFKHRKVALKVTTLITGEADKLAELIHPNIVEVYQVERIDRFQLICMPDRGTQTLAELLKGYQDNRNTPPQGDVSTKAVAKLSTMVQRSPLPEENDPPPTIPPNPVARIGNISWAVKTIKACADGLGYAHKRDILHIDMKPSNIIISNDGTPRIIDFNLSYKHGVDSDAKTGGTFFYMSPEQLVACSEQRMVSTLTPATDLYSLGCIFFEMLTGEPAFPRYEGKPNPRQLLIDRKGEIPHLSKYRPDISPALDAIVRKLLQANPEERYQTAEALIEDLDCYSARLPLVHAPNPCAVERTQNFLFRNSIILQRLSMIGAFCLVVGTAFSAYSAQEAQANSTAHEDLQKTSLHFPHLTMSLLDAEKSETRDAAKKQLRSMIDSYGLCNMKPALRSKMRRLPPATQQQFRDRVAELCRVVTYVEMLPNDVLTEEHRLAHARTALEWNELAEQCYGEASPSSLFEERTRIESSLKEKASARGRQRDVVDDLSEQRLQAMQAYAEGNCQVAIQRFRALLKIDSKQYEIQYLLGMSYLTTKDYSSARDRFLLAKPLPLPDGRPVLQRGIIAMIENRQLDAVEEFTEAYERDSQLYEALKHRANVYRKLQRFDEARNDLDVCIAANHALLQTHILRAEVRRTLGDLTGGQKDLDAIKKIHAVSAQDHCVRGRSREATDPAGALKDYELASEISPTYYPAWHSQLRIYADILEQPQKALEVQERSSKLFPQSAHHLASKAVLEARLGKRQEAHEAIQKALEYSPCAEIELMAAFTYAQTSRIEGGDAIQAIDALRRAMKAGYRNWAKVETDLDLKPLTTIPEFQQLIRAGKELQK